MKSRKMMLIICICSALSMVVWATLGFIETMSSNNSNFTITGSCSSYEGCGYEVTVPLHLDRNGLVIPPPESRFCPKCGKMIFWESKKDSDITNQLLPRQQEDK